jgi:hypothetical protein
MKVRIATLTAILILVALASYFDNVPVLARQAEATPSAGDHTSAPKFALVAVGDYPEGYFDDTEIGAGQSKTLTVKVVNFGDVPAELRLYKVNALSGINGGFVADAEDASPEGSARWVDFPSQNVSLDPGVEMEIAFVVNVPEGTSPGQYISGLVARTQSALPIPGSNNLDHTLAYAISVSIVVPGSISAQFELGDPTFVMEAGSRRLQVPITSTGNYLVVPAGSLSLTNQAGEVVLSSDIDMKSVYAGRATVIDLFVPDQLPPGEYTVSLSLTDSASNAHDEFSDMPATLPELQDPTGISVDAATIAPNADPIAFANVAVTLNNGGQQLPASDVTMTVMRDGKEVEQFLLATNQVLPSGTCELTARYIPEKAWEPGTYTFTITVSAVDPNGGTETILTTYEVEDTIFVP